MIRRCLWAAAGSSGQAVGRVRRLALCWPGGWPLQLHEKMLFPLWVLLTTCGCCSIVAWHSCSSVSRSCISSRFFSETICAGVFPSLFHSSANTCRPEVRETDREVRSQLHWLLLGQAKQTPWIPGCSGSAHRCPVSLPRHPGTKRPHKAGVPTQGGSAPSEQSRRPHLQREAQPTPHSLTQTHGKEGLGEV